MFDELPKSFDAFYHSMLSHSISALKINMFFEETVLYCC